MPNTGPSTSNATTHKSNTGAIVGGVVGGLVGLALIGLAVILFLRRRSHRALGVEEKPESVLLAPPEPFVYNPEPSYNSEPSRSGIDAREEGRAPPIQPPIVTMTKSRLHAQNPSSTTTSAPTVSASAYSTSSGPASSHDPPSNTHDQAISPTEVRELRTEMENLRRVMQQIGVDNNEPPPTYAG